MRLSCWPLIMMQNYLKRKKFETLELSEQGKEGKLLFGQDFEKEFRFLKTFPKIAKIHTSTYWWAIPASLLGTFFS